MATIYTNGTGGGDNNTTSTYAGGIIPGDGDNLIIASGDTLNVTTDMTLGSNVSGIGHALDVRGILTGSAGPTLTLKGYDRDSNKAWTLSGEWNFGGKVKVPTTSEYQTIGTIESGAIMQPLSGAVFEGDDPRFSTWNPTVDYQAINNFLRSSSYAIKGRNLATGFIANAAGNGVGSFGDSSFVVETVTNPSGILATEVENFGDLTAHGDYWIDYNNGVLLFYTTNQVSYYAFSYSMVVGRWYGWGIDSTVDADKQSLFDGSIFRYMGAGFDTELSDVNKYATLNFSHHKSHGAVAARGMMARNCTFEWCTTPIQMYSCEGSGVDYIDLTGNTYKHTPPGDSGNYRGGHVVGITSTYIDTSDAICDGVAYIYRGFITDGFVKVNNCSGRISENLADSYQGLESLDGDYVAWGSISDGSGFSSAGTSDYPNKFERNVIKYGNRCGRVGSNLTVNDNRFYHFNHHGFVGPAADGYYENISVKNNVIAKCWGDMSGGYTFGYNYYHWLHNVVIENNTFDTGSRGIQFNDGEGTVLLATKASIVNNIISNTSNGIRRPDTDTNNQSKLQIDLMDNNNYYGNGNSADIVQATMIQSGVHYKSDSGNCVGVALFNPSDAPNPTGRALSMVVGTTSITLSWGGGDSVELVNETGTATGGDWNTIIDTSKSWDTNIHRCKNVLITSGDMAGNIYMVKSNNSNSLELLWKSGNASYANVTGANYRIIDPEVILTDSLGETIHAGICVFELTSVVGTYVDSNITIETNHTEVDPGYVSISNYNYTPTNEILATSGYGGTYVGAIDITSPPSPPGNNNPYFTIVDITMVDVVTLDVNKINLN